MNHRNGIAAILGWLWLLNCVWCTGFAQAEGAVPDKIALRVEPAVVSQEALRLALAAELHVEVVAAESAPQGIPVLTVSRLASGNVEVALSSRNVPRASRELRLPSENPEERVEVLALIAANLVHNEANALLPELALADAPPVLPPTPCAFQGRSTIGVDVAPWLGSSSTEGGRAATRSISLGLFGTLSSRLHGLELSIGVNVQKLSVCGAQATYLANVSLGPVQGAQLSTINVARGTVVGVQGGLLNLAFGDLAGAQLGMLNLTAGSVHGVQGGQVNYASSVTGSQLGLVNLSAGDVDGVQVGLFNYAGRSRASIGAFSIVRRGRTSIDALTTLNTATPSVGITHGGRYVHNTLALGLHASRTGMVPMGFLGLGVRAVHTPRMRIDVDAFYAQLITSHMDTRPTAITGMRLPVTFMVWRGLGLLVAPSVQTMITRDPGERTRAFFGNAKLHEGKTRVLGYPDLTVGLRYEFDHGL